MPTIKKGKRRPWQGERKAFDRKRKEADNSAFYNARRWRKHRALFLSKYPLCRKCEQNEFIVAATVVDHITRINDGGAKYAYSNLQPLCKTCHNSKSGKEAHG